MSPKLSTDDLLDTDICSDPDDCLLGLNIDEYRDILDQYAELNTEKFFE